MKHSRSILLAAVVGLAALLGGCVVAPAAYPAYGYGYNAAVVAPAPVVVAPPVSVGIGIGYYSGSRGYYSGGRGYWRGRPGYWGRGHWR